MLLVRLGHPVTFQVDETVRNRLAERVKDLFVDKKKGHKNTSFVSVSEWPSFPRVGKTLNSLRES